MKTNLNIFSLVKSQRNVKLAPFPHRGAIYLNFPLNIGQQTLSIRRGEAHCPEAEIRLLDNL